MYRLSGESLRKLIPATSFSSGWECAFKDLKKKSFPEVKSLAIYNARDVHPFPVLFPNTERVLFYNCDKNTHFYWALNHCFPKCRELEMEGHPCQASLVYRCIHAVKKHNLKLTISSAFLENWLRYGGKSEGLQTLIEQKSVLVKKSQEFDQMFDQFKKELE